MHVYSPKTFAIPSLEGISQKSIDEHIGLYQGYVKNFNAISKLTAELAVQDSEKYAHAVSELVRRRSFEFDGMRLHELYFAQFEGGASPLTEGSALATALENSYTPYTFQNVAKNVALMRGPGWAILYLDPESNELLLGFVGEQHVGHYATLPIILALDVWEHAFLLDHGAQGKSAYIDAFFKNLNWKAIESRFSTATKT